MLSRGAPYSLPPASEAVLRSSEATKSARDELVEHVARQPSGSVTVVDLHDDDYSGSAIDEMVLAGLLQRISAGLIRERYVVLENVSEATREEIAFILERLREREAATVLLKSDGTRELVGDIGPKLRATWEFMVRRGVITSGDVAERFNISLSNAGNRLTALGKLGLAHQAANETPAGGGRRYRWIPVS